MKKAINIIGYILCAILCLFGVWVIASFIEVFAHNLTDHAYSWWNVFIYF